MTADGSCVDLNTPGGTPDLKSRGGLPLLADATSGAVTEDEHRFQAIIAASADPVMMISADLHVLYASPEAERLLSEAGTTPDDMMTAVHPDDLEPVQAAFFEVLNGRVGHKARVDMRVRQHDGWHWIAAWIVNQVGVPGVDSLVTYGRDVTAQYEAEDALRSRLVVDEVVKRISLRLVDVGADEIDHAVVESLADLAELCGADRAWIFRIDPGQRLISNTHEWCAPGVPSEIAQLKGLVIDELEGFSTWIGDPAPLVVNRLEELGPALANERAILEGQLIKSMVAQSMYARGELFGMVGLDAVHESVAWSEQTVQALDACATVLGAALRRCDAEMAMADNEARFRAMNERAWDGLRVLDAELRVIYSSPAVERITGHPEPDLVDPGIRLLLVHPDDRHVVEAQRVAVLANPGDTQVCTYRFSRPDGSWIHLSETATNLLDDPAVGGVVVNLRDVTERHNYEAELVAQARRDLATGLPDRLLFEELLDAAVARSALTGSCLAVIAVDLDRFRLVNESLGHPAGDAVLALAGRRLDGVVRGGDLLARRGADEFVILCEPITDDELADLTDAIVQAFREPFVIDGNSAYTTASVGASLSDPGNAQASTLIREADAALASAKETGGDRAVRFRGVLADTARVRLDLETELRHALHAGDFRLLYQPVVDQVDGRVLGAEALLRWEHPLKGRLAPDQFLDVCEQTGLIGPLGTWVLGEALGQLRTWHEELSPSLSMHVNVSARQLRPKGLATVIATLLDDTEVEPSKLCVEVTESALLGGEAAVQELAAIRRLGVPVALDDFGTGHSSLSHLRDFEIDALKIDRQFVEGLIGSGSDLAIVSAIIDLARMLSLGLVGEGVETKEQADALARLGCRRMQGYWFARPLTADAFVEFVRERGADTGGDERVASDRHPSIQ